MIVDSVLEIRADILDGDRRTLKAEQKKIRERIFDLVFGAYTVLYVCGVSGPERVRMEQGSDTLAGSVLKTLYKADMIHDKIDSNILATMYPGQTDAEAIYESMMRTPGTVRPTSVDVVRRALPAVQTGGTDGGPVEQTTLTGDSNQAQTGETDGGTTAGGDAQEPVAMTKIVARMSVESGREFDVAKLLQDAFKAGFSCSVIVTMEGGSKLHNKFGDLQDLAKDIDPFGMVDHGC